MKTLIEIHALQNFAPSNLNRDDTGVPKDAFFGGTRRARVSSQCDKRAIRSKAGGSLIRKSAEALITKALALNTTYPRQSQTFVLDLTKTDIGDFGTVVTSLGELLDKTLTAVEG